MRRKKQSLAGLLTIVMSMSITWACTNNSTGNNDNNNNNGGNTTTYYAQNIQPIFSGSCGGASCHIPGATSGVNLSDYSNAIGSTGIQYGTKIIITGDAASSPLIDKINSANPKHGVRMPNGGSPLSQAKIDTLKAWINRGAKEDS